MIRKSLYALSALWVFSGCIYTFGTGLPKGKDKVFFSIPKNSSGYPLVQDVSFNYGFQILKADGRLNLVDSSRADLILLTDFTSYTKAPERYDNSGKVLTYRLSLRGKVEFVDRKTGEDFVPPTSIEGTTLWNPDTESEEEALRRAVSDFYSQAVRYLFSKLEW